MTAQNARVKNTYSKTTKGDSRFEGRSVVFHFGSLQYRPEDVTDFCFFIWDLMGFEPFKLTIEGEDVIVRFHPFWMGVVYCPERYDGTPSIYKATGKTRAEALYNLIEQISEYNLSKL
jgi:hypothetical protein